TPRPPDADDALKIGARAADFLLSISYAPGAPLEYFPPTYKNNTPEDKEHEDQTMLISAAEVGQGYLNLYDVTHDEKYLTAVKHIADTYQKLQLPTGTWYLKIDVQTTKPIADIELIPSVVVSFIDRLITQYHQPQYQ